MKKVYLFLLFIMLGSTGFSQITEGAAYINANGALGSFKTGYTRATTRRTDDNMVVGNAPASRGYAVFDITSAVPPAAIVDSVNIRFNFHSSNTRLTDACTIYADAADLSTVTTSAALYAAIISGTSVNTTNWGMYRGVGTAQDLLPFNAAGITFIQSNLGTIISVGFQATVSTNIYTIRGEGGAADTIPQLQIFYHCPDVSGVNIAVSPGSTICGNQLLTLTGSYTSGSTSSWSGPGGFSSSSLVATTNPVYPVGTGVYSLTVTGASGCSITDTTTITVIKGPSPIVGVASGCVGSPVVVGDDSTTGTWGFTPSSVGSISTGGIITLSNPGTGYVTYSFTDGCTVYDTITVYPPAPTPIVGSATLCNGLNDTLSDGIAGGSWISSNVTIATVTPTGIVTALAIGVDTIVYNTGCNPFQSFIITIDSLPDSISAPDTLCMGDTVTVHDASPLGYWSTNNSGWASVNSAGLVTGVYGSVATISYSFFANGCAATKLMTINSAPNVITGNNNVCIGSTQTLADSVLGGTWSSSNISDGTITSTGIVTGVSYGTITITYSNICGSSYYTEYVDSLPDAIQGGTSVCYGSTVTLSDNSPSGIWRSSTPSVAYAAPGLGTVLGVTTGSATITYELPTGCYVTEPFSVNVLPVSMTGILQACPGTSTTLSDVNTGGSFSTGNFNVAVVGASNGIVTGVNPGICPITYTLPTGCITVDTITINPNPEPIVGNNVICDSLPDTLYSPTDSGTWSSSTLSGGVVAITSITPDTGAYVARVAGTSIVTYTLLHTGCIAVDTITIHPAPVPVIYYNPADSTFSTQTYFTSYQWYMNDTIIQGATSPNLAALYKGYNYTVLVTDTFGCSAFSVAYVYYPAGVNNINQQNNARIYPNPASGELFIDAPMGAKSVIADMEGKVLMESTDANTINLSSLASGLYMVTIYNKDGDRILIQKLVKQ